MSYLIINYYYYWLIKGRSLWLAGCCNAHAQESSFSVGPRRGPRLLLVRVIPAVPLSLFRFLLLSTSLFLVSLMSSAGPFGCTYLQPLRCWSGPEVASSDAPQFLRSLCSLQWLLRLTAQGDQCLVCCKNSC